MAKACICVYLGVCSCMRKLEMDIPLSFFSACHLIFLRKGLLVNLGFQLGRLGIELQLSTRLLSLSLHCQKYKYVPLHPDFYVGARDSVPLTYMAGNLPSKLSPQLQEYSFHLQGVLFFEILFVFVKKSVLLFFFFFRSN